MNILRRLLTPNLIELLTPPPPAYISLQLQALDLIAGYESLVAANRPPPLPAKRAVANPNLFFSDSEDEEEAPLPAGSVVGPEGSGEEGPVGRGWVAPALCANVRRSLKQRLVAQALVGLTRQHPYWGGGGEGKAVVADEGGLIIDVHLAAAAGGVPVAAVLDSVRRETCASWQCGDAIIITDASVRLFSTASWHCMLHPITASSSPLISRQAWQQPRLFSLSLPVWKPSCSLPPAVWPES